MSTKEKLLERLLKDFETRELVEYIGLKNFTRIVRNENNSDAVDYYLFNATPMADDWIGQIKGFNDTDESDEEWLDRFTEELEWETVTLKKRFASDLEMAFMLYFWGRDDLYFWVRDYEFTLEDIIHMYCIMRAYRAAAYQKFGKAVHHDERYQGFPLEEQRVLLEKALKRYEHEVNYGA